nr:hypothetical protein [Candidatus Neomarinimicrobiota bacterium]
MSKYNFTQSEILNQWKLLQEQVNTCFDNNQYSKTVSLIPVIEKYNSYLPEAKLKKSKDLIGLIKSENEQWETYKSLFTALKTKFIKAFIENGVNSSIVSNALSDFTKLEKLAKKFIKGYKPQPEISVNKDTILTVDERIQVVDFLINCGSEFEQTKLSKLKQRLLNRKDELANISSDSKTWFDNPTYFEKYPDHPQALKSIPELLASDPMSFNKVYQTLKSLSVVKPYFNSAATRIKVEKREVELTNNLIKYRFLAFKTKRRLALDLVDDSLFNIALYVAQQYPDIKNIVAEKQTEAGLFKEAVSTAKQINDKDDRS